MKKFIHRIKDKLFVRKAHFKTRVTVTEATDDDLHIQYPTFEEFERAVRDGEPCKLD